MSITYTDSTTARYKEEYILSSQSELSSKNSLFKRDYYDLTSWLDSNGTTHALGSTITSKSSVSISAQWKPTEYSITYQLDGGTNGNNPTSYNIESETSALQDATKFQYAFDKWTENGSQILSIEQGSHGDKTLSASYIRTKVTATYHCNRNKNSLLYFESKEDSSTITLTKVGEPYEVTLVSSDNGTDWNYYTIGDTYTYTSVGSKFYLKKADSDTSLNLSKDRLNNTYRFNMSGKIEGYGNIQWLLDSTGNSLTCTDYCYSHLFYTCSSLMRSPELCATTIGQMSYYDMFYKCASLSTAPILPATNLSTACYYFMFENCYSLTSAPLLPASNLVIGCYGGMFDSCSSLVSSYDLTAENAVKNCYNGMFQNCTSLLFPPVISARNAADGCFIDMFRGCSKLRIAQDNPDYGTEFLNTNGYVEDENWEESWNGTMFKYTQTSADVPKALIDHRYYYSY